MQAKCKNIYLVGLMGAGKTTVGRTLAKRLGWQFFDSDHEIAARTGVSIPTIFEIEGEAGFRRRESLMIEELAGLNNIVLATGGGAVLAEHNRECLRRSGLVVYLCASPMQLFERTRHDRNRPLLQVPDPLGRLKELLAERGPLYEELADIVIDGNRGNATSAIQQIMCEMDKRCSH
ncbi:MAG: shikimate kinase [Rhodocyclaceae bacterium]|nr:MAG: shikimate kinase [Rhodocyclaceae bacterium]